MARRYGRYGRFGSIWPSYVPAYERQARAEAEIARLRKKGRTMEPVEIAGGRIASTFWGKAWCTNLESYSDYANRLPRGRSYVRNGSVIHLEVGRGRVEALVRGTRTYEVAVTIAAITKARWTTVVSRCSGQVGSLVELLQGSLSKGVMEIVTDRERGLFPSPKEIRLSCSCPDWATMCKHVAAVMYGVGARLDERPDLLFRLRGVEPTELLTTAAVRHATAAPIAHGRALDESSLGAVFGIDIDDGREAGPARLERGGARRSANGGASAPRSPARGASASSPVSPDVGHAASRARRPISRPTRSAPAPAEASSARSVRVTIAELAAAGVLLGELSDCLAARELERTRQEGVYLTTPAVRTRLLGGGRRATGRRARE